MLNSVNVLRVFDIKSFFENKMNRYALSATLKNSVCACLILLTIDLINDGKLDSVAYFVGIVTYLEQHCGFFLFIKLLPLIKSGLALLVNFLFLNRQFNLKNIIFEIITFIEIFVISFKLKTNENTPRIIPPVFYISYKKIHLEVFRALYHIP